MVSCWCLDIHQRPRFSGLVTKFSDLLERDAGYLELSRSLSWRKTGTPLKEESASAAGPHALQSVEGATIEVNVEAVAGHTDM